MDQSLWQVLIMVHHDSTAFVHLIKILEITDSREESEGTKLCAVFSIAYQ
jgi:hypothetical protein